MHRRAAAPSVSSSRIAASRDRRAARRTNNLINAGAGSIGIIHNPTNSHSNGRHHNKSSGGNLKRIAFVGVGVVVLFLLVAWGGALYHVTTSSSDGDDHNVVGGGVKNALRRMRNPYNKPIKKSGRTSSSIDYTNPYTLDSLKHNPHLGWQPKIHPSPPSFSWRTCFKADAKSDGTDQPPGCREHPSELGPAPPVDNDWIPDVTMIRTMMMHGADRNGEVFPPVIGREMCEDIGVFGGKDGDTNKECLRKVGIQPTGKLNSTTVTIAPSNHYGADGMSEGTLEVPAPKIMCLVYTMADAHANRIRAMRDTWAGGCDGFLAFSTESDPRLPAISLEHDGPEEYNNMWQKIRSIWKFVGTHYLEDYDWFFIGGDDLFVLPHNLKTYLASLTQKDGTDPKTKEYFVGRRFNSGGTNGYFNSGGAGYSLSQATLRKFFANIEDAQHCSAKSHTSMEDVMIARCLSYLGIHFTDTRDARGRERFHPFAPGSHLHWSPPGPGKPRDWYEDYNKEWGILTGTDCCAPDSVSFHYIKKASMVRHMQSLLYFCDEEDR
eukprot:g1573.t1 g1573   contig10:2367169-2368815(-)